MVKQTNFIQLFDLMIMQKCQSTSAPKTLNLPESPVNLFPKLSIYGQFTETNGRKLALPPAGSDSSSSSSQFTTPMHKQTQFHPSLKAMGEAGKEWPSGAGKYKKVATMSTGWSLPGSELRGETHTGKAFILSLRAGGFCMSVCVCVEA